MRFILESGCKVLLVLTFVAASISASGQLGKFAADKFLIRNSSAVFAKNGVPIKGTPFLDENYSEGTIYGETKSYSGLKMRFNAFHNNLEFLQDGRPYVLEPTNRIQKVTLGNMVLVVDKFEFGNDVKEGFLERLDSGRVTLLHRQTILFREGEDPTPMKYQGEPAKFVKGTETFYYRMNGKLIRIDKTKDFVAGLTEHNAEVKAFIKKEKIKKNKEDLIKLSQYYNSLNAGSLR